MSVGKENKLIQVKISKLAYQFIKKYSDMFNISLSKFCEMAINDQIIRIGELKND